MILQQEAVYFPFPLWDEGLHRNAWGGEKLICSLAAWPTRTPLSYWMSPPPSPLSPVSTQTELSQKLTLCSKLCFAIGGAPKEVAASATAFFLQIYLLDIAQVMCLRPHRMRKAFIYEWTKCVCFLTPVCPCSSLQINAFQASMVLFIGKAWGAVTDPVVGFFITKSRWTKIGRLMPWWAPCSHYKVTPLNSPCISTVVSFVLFYLFYHISKFRFFSLARK